MKRDPRHRCPGCRTRISNRLVACPDCRARIPHLLDVLHQAYLTYRTDPVAYRIARTNCLAELRRQRESTP